MHRLDLPTLYTPAWRKVNRDNLSSALDLVVPPSSEDINVMVTKFDNRKTSTLEATLPMHMIKPEGQNHSEAELTENLWEAKSTCKKLDRK